jgi:predicted Fe-Mo cluster-binding NifX family protein
VKIAVPSNDGTTIASHFGRARYFIVFEANKGTVLGKKLIENNPYHNDPVHEHGSHHSHERFLVLLSGSQVLIARGMGRRAVVDLEAAGIKPVFTETENAEEAACAYSSGTLKDCSQPDCGHH